MSVDPEALQITTLSTSARVGDLACKSNEMAGMHLPVLTSYGTAFKVYAAAQCPCSMEANTLERPLQIPAFI